MDVEYRVVYSKRKTVSLAVERDASVVVHAPEGTPAETIRALVEAKKFWIYQKRRIKQKYPANPARKEFVSGESLRYLGRNYMLDVIDENIDGVQFGVGFRIARRQQVNARVLIREWYTKQAQEMLETRARAHATALGVEFGQLRVTDMRLRWGSCTPKNNLNFNWRIMKAPIFVIDYVIVHELAHLLEANHTPRFWNIVAVAAPRSEIAKAWLREYGGLLEEDY